MVSPSELYHKPRVLSHVVFRLGSFFFFGFLSFFLNHKNHHPFCAYDSTKIRPRLISGTNRHFWVMNCKLSHLRKQYFSCKRSVLAIAADISIESFHNRIYANKTETVSVAFCAAEQLTFLFHFLTGCKVGKGNVELGILHIHIYTDHTLILR